MTQSAGGGAGRPFAVVTGGSEGIGLAIAERLVRDGTDVLIVARDEARLQAVARQLADTGPGRVEVLPLDVTVPQAGGLIEERVAKTGGAESRRRGGRAKTGKGAAGTATEPPVEATATTAAKTSSAKPKTKAKPKPKARAKAKATADEPAS